MPGHLIRRLNQRSTAVFQDRMKSTGYDLTSVQFAALDLLRRNPGIDQAGLASAIAYDRATIGEVVKRLEQKGLVERTVNEQDRRARALHLTMNGQDVIGRLRPVVHHLQADILGNLTDEERAQFTTLARKAVALDDD
ncbi:MarR family transcriptional regulator [Paracoccus sp. 11-3]|uniref:MarR family transcriptional regulator n=1 Tax=Paracoccus amoyensis TaxID=2760093 RepID=A0A926GFG6_9RHOB|nr:MarR family transcriptional regulator [Paracoccus amoyensis]MBC9247621.1 MarR family transcriptional regulator [Paracoccus amoyensis]